jgi:hypothetical protein
VVVACGDSSHGFKHAAGGRERLAQIVVGEPTFCARISCEPTRFPCEPTRTGRPGPRARPCHTEAMSEPVLPMSTLDTLPQGLPEGSVISRSAVLASRHHATPGEARDALAEWAQRCEYDAVVGVRFVATAERLNPGEGTTSTLWAAYGTAIGW